MDSRWSAELPEPLLPIVLYFTILIMLALMHFAGLKALMRTERAVLVTHILLFAALPPVASWLLPNAGESYFSVLVTFYGIHACFSLCWLEIWSLSQGGFSLQILEQIDRRDDVDLTAFATQIGQEKLNGRLDGLVAIGLVRRTASQYSLSPLGRLVAIGTTAVANVAGTKIRE